MTVLFLKKFQTLSSVQVVEGGGCWCCFVAKEKVGSIKDWLEKLNTKCCSNQARDGSFFGGGGGEMRL